MGKSTDGKNVRFQQRESGYRNVKVEWQSGAQRTNVIIKFLESTNLLKHFTVYQKRFYTFSMKDVETDHLSLCVPFESSTSGKLMHVIKRFFFNYLAK